MRFRTSRKNLFLTVAFLLIAALLAGCGQKPAPAPADPEAGEAKPVILRRAFAYGGDPGNCDPLLASRVGAITVVRMLFDSVLEYNAVSGEFLPRIAKDWSISPDGTVYTFVLNEGIKFHNGRELVADDVKYTFERILDPANASPLAGGYQDIVGAKDFQDKKADDVSGIKVIDDHTVEITIETVNPLFLYTMTESSSSIVPKEEVERLGDSFGHEPIGTGPFVFESWRKDDRIVVKANDDWFKGRPTIDGIEYRVLPENATQQAEFIAGNLDYIVLTAAQYNEFSNNPEWKDYVVEVPELFTRIIGFNTTKPPFDKVEVRQAFNYAIDKEAIIDSVLHNKAFNAIGVLPTSMPGFNEALVGYDYNPDKAKELLAKAGYPDGFEAEVLCTDNVSWGLPPIEAAMGYLNQVGIKLKPVLMDANTMADRTRVGDFQCYGYSTGGDASALSYVNSRFHSKFADGLGNTTRYSNAQVDEYLDQAMAESDLQKQIELVQKAEEIITEEAPWFFFNYNKAALVHHPWLEGIQPIPTDIDFQVMENMKINK